MVGCVYLGSLTFSDQTFTKAPSYLSRLRRIEGTPTFFRNGQMLDITALRSLTFAGELRFDTNAKLESLAGLENLRSVRGTLTISSNGVRSLAPLSALESVGDLTAYGDSLPESEFDRLAAQVHLARLDAGQSGP